MITIKETTKEDLASLLLLWNDGQVMKWVGFPDGLNTTIEAMHQWFTNLKPHEKHFSIYDNEQKFCGETFYRLSDITTVDIKLFSQFQNKGIAAYALSYAMREALEHNPDTTLMVDPHYLNEDAIRLYLKLGFMEKTNNGKHIEMICTKDSFKFHHHISIRPIMKQDLYELWQNLDQHDSYWYQAWDGPYFPKSKPLSYEEFLEKRQESFLDPKRYHIICVDQSIEGIISAYFEDEMKHWLEIGLILFDEKMISKGIGTRAIKLWLTYLFEQYDVPRIGLTTWSGNKRMIKAATKSGMSLEAQIRLVRYYQGQYYDSVRYGITRKEFELTHKWSVSTINDPIERKNIAKTILNDLPQWFGIPSSTQTYIDECQHMTMLAIKDQGKPVGFISLKSTKKTTLEINVMGVLSDYHRQQIGSRLILESIKYAKINSYQLLQVKTLDDKHPDQHYASTRKFYRHHEFIDLECFDSLWDDPCLILVKAL